MYKSKYCEKFQENIIKAKEEKEIIEVVLENLRIEVEYLESNEYLLKTNQLLEKEIKEKVKKLNSIKATILFNESLLDHINQNLKEYRSYTLKKMFELLNGSFKERLEGKEALEYLSEKNPDLKLCTDEE